MMSRVQWSLGVLVAWTALSSACSSEVVVYQPATESWVAPSLLRTVGPSTAAPAPDGSCSWSGLTRCGDRCVDLQGDARDCGACGRACATGQVCSLGLCGVVTCTAAGRSLCADATGLRCADTANDPRHCGSCATACTARQTCVSGRCNDWMCTPGAVGCRDMNTPNVCDPSGIATTARAACGAEQSCRDGACVPQVCRPGSRRCVEGMVMSIETCAPDGLSYASSQCGMGQSCDNGACTMQSCTAGSLQCAGALSIRTCNVNGVGYGAEAPCPAGQGCNATANACRAFTCMPTMGVSCSGIAARNVCDANGLGTTVAACAMNESCRDGACLPRICAPGTNRCVTGNPAQVENCNTDGLGVTATTCPMGQSCSSGTCVPQSCTAGSTQCVGPTSIRTCNADGLAYASPVDCPSGQGCNATANACRVFTCIPTMGVSCSGIAARNVCDANGLGTTVAACAMNESCRDGACLPRICAPGTNRCVTGNPAQVENCNTDGLGWTATTCPTGQSCSSGTCVPQSCTAGSTQCVGPTSIRTCNADGLAYASPVDCPSGQGCNATANACRAFTCTPGVALVCYASSGRTVCNADGQATSAVPCGATESCRDGACRTRICSPGALRCAPGSVNQVETCDTDGLGWTATTCAAGFACSGGTCVRQVCTPGTPSCAASGVGTRSCSLDGLGYGPTTTCNIGASCDVATGMCAGYICTPGSATCVGNGRQVCNADGRGYSTTNCGSRQTCSAGICVNWTCTPGEYSCADINTRRVCNADGFGYSAAACPTMNACLGVGVCTAWTCTPGSAGPVCGSTTGRQVCNADGQGYATVACAAGQGCVAGACAVRCGDGIVGTGEMCDDGNTTAGDGCSATCLFERCASVGFNGASGCGSYQQGPVVTARIPELAGTSAVTIEGWVRLISYTQYGTPFAVTNGLVIPAFAGRTGVTCAGDIGYGDNRNKWGTGGIWSYTTIPLGTWQHLAWVHQGTTFRFYVDGVLQGTSSTAYPAFASGDVFVVGGTPGNTCNNANSTINGNVAEVRISSVARYTTNFTPPLRHAVDSDTVLLWRLDEGSGTSVFDASGRGHVGTLQRGSTWASICPGTICVSGAVRCAAGSTTRYETCTSDGRGYVPRDCTTGATCDSTLNRCVTAWQGIPRFSGNQGCGPYYTVNLPGPMNQFRASGLARVSGGFVSVVVPSGQTTTTDLASGTCRTAITSDETWLVGEIRSLRNRTACTNPRDTNFLATQLIGCGVYDYSLEGRRVYW